MKTKANKFVVYFFMYLLPLALLDFFWIVMLQKAVRLGYRNNLLQIRMNSFEMLLTALIVAVVFNYLWQYLVKSVTKSLHDQTPDHFGGLLKGFLGIPGWLNLVAAVVIAFVLTIIVPRHLLIIEIRSWLVLLCAYGAIGSFYNGQDDLIHIVNGVDRWAGDNHNV